MRPSKGIINLANLTTILAIYLRKLSLLQMQKVQCKCLHTQQSCEDFTYLICAAVFSVTF